MFDTTSFNNQIAVDLEDPTLAIVVQFFINTICAHKRAKRNFKKGKTWNYCTYAELVEYFPYWTEKQIRGRINNLVEKKVLIVDSFNKSKWDKTNWYAFQDEERWGISKVSYVCPNGQIEDHKKADGSDQKGSSIPFPYSSNTSSDDDDRVREEEKESSDDDSEILKTKDGKDREHSSCIQSIIKFMTSKRYTYEIIKEAIERTRVYKGPINNVLKFVEAICKDIISKKESIQQIKEKEWNKTYHHSNKYSKSGDTKTLTKPSDAYKEPITDPATLGRPLANWRSLLQQPT